MKLKFNILKQNKKLEIDNTKATIPQIMNKLGEEYCELQVAFINYTKNKTLSNLKEIIRETYDLIQVCILVLFRANITANTLEEYNLIADINKEHIEKLKGRGWETEADINVEVERKE